MQITLLLFFTFRIVLLNIIYIIHQIWTDTTGKLNEPISSLNVKGGFTCNTCEYTWQNNITNAFWFTSSTIPYLFEYTTVYSFLKKHIYTS